MCRLSNEHSQGLDQGGQMEKNAQVDRISIILFFFFTSIIFVNFYSLLLKKAACILWKSTRRRRRGNEHNSNQRTGTKSLSEGKPPNSANSIDEEGLQTCAMIEGIAGIFCCLRRKNPSKSDAKWPSTELRHYKFYELEKATDSFSEGRLIGSGAFGNVYKGVFDGEKRTLAIKRAHSGSYQTLEEFRNEVELLSRVRHKNLVGLVGYCTETEQKVLVYEYVSQGCLLEYIVGKEREPLTWQQRVNIAIGTAKGIAHLHEVQPCIIHRDVKPSNILIDDQFEPKVSDFGLVKLGPAGDASHVSTQVKGTPGYMDPAYCSSLHLTTASDVFSFGVILLQLVTASPALDHTRHKSAYHISDWARYSVECGMVEAILDGNLLLEECNTKTMLKMAQLGLRCTAWQPKDRPTMSQVTKELEEAMQQAQRSVWRPTSSDESQSVSIDGVGLQRFYVEGCDDLSTSSTNFTCFDASGRSSGDSKNKLSGISEEHL